MLREHTYMNNLAKKILSTCFLSIVYMQQAFAEFKLPEKIGDSDDSGEFITNSIGFYVPIGVVIMLVISVFMFGNGLMDAYKEYQNKHRSVPQFFKDAGVSIFMMVAMAIAGGWIGDYISAYV